MSVNDIPRILQITTDISDRIVNDARISIMRYGWDRLQAVYDEELKHEQ